MIEAYQEAMAADRLTTSNVTDNCAIPNIEVLRTHDRLADMVL
jgi:hypothetical protein